MVGAGGGLVNPVVGLLPVGVVVHSGAMSELRP